MSVRCTAHAAAALRAHALRHVGRRDHRRVAGDTLPPAHDCRRKNPLRSYPLAPGTSVVTPRPISSVVPVVFPSFSRRFPVVFSVVFRRSVIPRSPLDSSGFPVVLPSFSRSFPVIVVFPLFPSFPLAFPSFSRRCKITTLDFLKEITFAASPEPQNSPGALRAPGRAAGPASQPAWVY